VFAGLSLSKISDLGIDLKLPGVGPVPRDPAATAQV
jgi:hypothetical protein